jgi:hypothetical protein
VNGTQTTGINCKPKQHKIIHSWTISWVEITCEVTDYGSKTVSDQDNPTFFSFTCSYLGTPFSVSYYHIIAPILFNGDSYVHIYFAVKGM